MLPLFLKASVIVWREAIEAILIVGVINAFFVRKGASTATFRFLWGGVLGGIALSLVLGVALVGLGDALPENLFSHFQTGLVFVCALLMAQMVFWMRRHARAMQLEIERKLEGTLRAETRWSLFFIALTAVAREGSEAVVYLMGSVAENTVGLGHSSTLAVIGLATVAGILAAWVCVRLISVTFKFLPLKRVLLITTIWFLCAASALWVTGIERLESIDGWPFSTAMIWDLTGILSTHSALGGVLRALIGYRDRATAAEAMGWLAFWGVMIWAFRRPLGALKVEKNPKRRESQAMPRSLRSFF